MRLAFASVREPEGRPLTDAETAALDFMLSADFPGAQELREQAKTARVVRRCRCGCPSIESHLDASGGPGSGRVVATADSRDERFTHLMLWADRGYLSGIELSWLEIVDELPSPDLFDPPRSG